MLDHGGPRLGTSALDDAPAQRLRRSGPLGRVGQRGDGLSKQSELLRAVLAVGEVPLEAFPLLVVEGVERVGR